MAEYAQAAAKDDFEKALQLAPGKPEIYLEMARNFEKDKSGRDKARQILEDGLKKAPKSMELYQTLAKIELRRRPGRQGNQNPGRRREEGVGAGPLRLNPGRVLARRGDTGKLRLQIDELEKIGYSPLALPAIS